MSLRAASISTAAATRTRSTERGQAVRRRAASSTRSDSVSRQSPNDKRFGSRAPSIGASGRGQPVPPTTTSKDVTPKRDSAEVRFRRAQQAQQRYEADEMAKRQRHVGGASSVGILKKSSSISTSGVLHRHPATPATIKNNIPAAHVPSTPVPPPHRTHQKPKFFVMSPEVAHAIQMAKRYGSGATTPMAEAATAEVDPSIRSSSWTSSHPASRVQSIHAPDTKATVEQQRSLPPPTTAKNTSTTTVSSSWQPPSRPDAITNATTPLPLGMSVDDVQSIQSTIELCRVIHQYQAHNEELEESIAAVDNANRTLRIDNEHRMRDNADRRTTASSGEAERRRRQRLSIINKQILILEAENGELRERLYGSDGEEEDDIY